MAIRQKRVFFPWEKPKGLLGALGRARTRQVLGGGVALVVGLLIWRREDHAAAVRATRASLTTATRAIYTYRADHAGACPKELAQLRELGYVHETPGDAWGRPLRLVCPGRKDPAGFDLSSDGPDGLMGGLDRVE
jgi:general secretion pathway protein G